jgi:cytochrome b561
MNWKNPADRWGSVSQAFHWLVVALILVMAYLGLTMTDLPNSPHKIRLYALHKSIGLTILALVALRLLWRWYAGTPRPLDAPRWQARVATATHWALYGLLFAMPLSGWLVNSAAGFPLQWFGLFNLPAIAPKDDAMHTLLRSTHEWLFWALVTTVALHAGAAVYHHFIQRDATLLRMLPHRRSQVGSPIARRPQQDAHHVR